MSDFISGYLFIFQCVSFLYRNCNSWVSALFKCIVQAFFPIQLILSNVVNAIKCFSVQCFSNPRTYMHINLLSAKHFEVHKDLVNPNVKNIFVMYFQMSFSFGLLFFLQVLLYYQIHLKVDWTVKILDNICHCVDDIYSIYSYIRSIYTCIINI